MDVRTAVLTAMALMAFAGNSLLCRVALADGAIDAASFSLIRLASGAATLLVVAGRARRPPASASAWASALVLVLYALPFSYAYGLVSAGTGALLLFGAVQGTMLLAAWRGGERLGARQWLGLALALAGLVLLVRPGLAAPPPVGAALMALAGVWWGIYSLRGRREPDPVAGNAGAFLYAVPVVGAVCLTAWPWLHVEPRGAALAVTSGALASGLGYVAWYAALRDLTATRASLVQLLVPVLTAVGGFAVLGEAITPRLVLSAVVVIGGLTLALAGGRGVGPVPRRTGDTLGLRAR